MLRRKFGISLLKKDEENIAQEIKKTSMDVHNIIESAVSKLISKTEWAVIRMRYGLDGDDLKTLEEVGEVIKKNRSEVRSIEASGLKKLMDYLK